MNDLSREEFIELRATIRERGSARIYVFVLSIAVWAGLTVAIALVGAAPVFTIVPLLVLWAGFEAVFQIHVGVERIGRYLQAYLEEAHASGVRWETTAMAFGRGFRAAGSDPLFVAVFAAAAFLNTLPALGEARVVLETATIAGAHVLFVARVLVARRAAAMQRDRDLERFRTLKKEHG